jgi:RNA polymerase sigma-70 factor (ECF subfamily)
MEWVTTTLLLEQLADGDEQAWALMVARFRDPMVAFVRRAGLPDDQADDVAQETLVSFLDAYRRGRYDRDKGRLRQWLFALAVQSLARHRRSWARQHQESPAHTAFWEELPGEDELRQRWDAEWDRHVFEHCVAQVRKEFKPVTVEAFEAQVIHERRPTDVARETGLSLSSVYVARHRVLKRIRELRGEYEHAVS